MSEKNEYILDPKDDAQELTEALLRSQLVKHFADGKPVTFEESKVAVRKRLGRPPVDTPKVPLSVRFDADVIEYFKSTGKGWQTRMNMVLREHVGAQREGSG
jgi:uncharacterized protein (DUF4415 family)